MPETSDYAEDPIYSRKLYAVWRGPDGSLAIFYPSDEIQEQTVDYEEPDRVISLD